MNLEHLMSKKTLDNTGFNTESATSSGRILNKNGETNVKKSGLSIFKQISLFHSLLEMKLSHFLLLVAMGFVLINIFFGSIYYFLGPESLGVNIQHAPFTQWIECVFFSSQTITTVGYGRLNPESISAGFIASLESFLGLISAAVLTGLIYGRFSKPKAFLLFSKHAIIAPFGSGKSLMLRIASYKNNALTDVEADLMAVMQNEVDGKIKTQYFPLKLATSKINTLALNWNIVHPINEESPIYEFTKEDFESRKIEFLVFIKGFDEHFANIVKERSSYHYSEIIFDAKFDIMYKPSDDGTSTILELDKIDSYTKLNN